MYFNSTILVVNQSSFSILAFKCCGIYRHMITSHLMTLLSIKGVFDTGLHRISVFCMLNIHMCTYKYIYTWVLVSVDF